MLYAVPYNLHVTVSIKSRISNKKKINKSLDFLYFNEFDLHFVIFHFLPNMKFLLIYKGWDIKKFKLKNLIKQTYIHNLQSGLLT